MKNWLHSLLNPFNTSRKHRAARRSLRLNVECLEDRTVPSTFSSITSNFNGTAIPAGDSVWFNSAFKASGLGSGPASIHVTDQSISFTSGSTNYVVDVPDSILNFSATNTVATTSFDAGQHAWITNLPMNWSGNAFLGGAGFDVATTLPGGSVKQVTWSGNFATDTAGVSLKWQWGAAVYTSFSTDYNALNVKPLDSNSATVFHNSDHAGTPEAFKNAVVGGARGGGGSNWTGSYSGTASVVMSAENFLVPATISGHAYTPTQALPGVTITLSGWDANGNFVFRTTETDANGYYEFTNVAPGSYTLNDSPFGPYVPTSAKAGTVDGMTNGYGESSSINEIMLTYASLGLNYDFFLGLAGPPNS